MANVKNAVDEVIKAEGFYSNDIGDNGGETVFGITRNFDKNWDGWVLVDEYKQKPNYPKNLQEIKQQLLEKSYPFYEEKYWQPIRGNEIENQNKANSIFSNCVNMGIITGIKLWQQTLNLPQTGKMDDDTLLATNNKEL